MFRNAAGARAATISAALTAALLAALAPISTVHAAAATEFAVTVVTVNGSGCPNSTATAQDRPDGSSFTIDFSGYLALAGDGASTTAFRRNCQFAIQITRPDGMTYAVAEAEYSGFALLNDGIVGVRAARYYFQGQPSTTAASHRFTGPLAEAWETVDVFSPDQLAFAPCSAERYLNLNTELRLTPQPATADLNAMVMDRRITLHLAWRACT